MTVTLVFIHGEFLNLSKSHFPSVSSLTQTVSKQTPLNSPRAIHRNSQNCCKSVSRTAFHQQITIAHWFLGPLFSHQGGSVNLVSFCDYNEGHFQKALTACQVLTETNLNSLLLPCRVITVLDIFHFPLQIHFPPCPVAHHWLISMDCIN